jgi:Ribosomal protein L7/L12 C-terminal domain
LEAKQLVQALPQILKENLGWFEATRLARHLRNFGADVEISETAAAKLNMSIIENSGPYPAE